MGVSVSTSGRALFLASVYLPPGSYTHTFWKILSPLCISSHQSIIITMFVGTLIYMLMCLRVVVANICLKLMPVTWNSWLINPHTYMVILWPQMGSMEVMRLRCVNLSLTMLTSAALIFLVPLFNTKITYRMYHCIDMDALRKDLQNTHFVNKPTSLASEQNKQYVHDVSVILEKHAPLVSRSPAKVSESFRLVTSIWTTWQRMKTPFNISRLRPQIARCNHLANNERCTYYKNLIAENSHDSRKPWSQLN